MKKDKIQVAIITDGNEVKSGFINANIVAKLIRQALQGNEVDREGMKVYELHNFEVEGTLRPSSKDEISIITYQGKPREVFVNDINLATVTYKYLLENEDQEWGKFELINITDFVEENFNV